MCSQDTATLHTWQYQACRLWQRHPANLFVLMEKLSLWFMYRLVDWISC